MHHRVGERHRPHTRRHSCAQFFTCRRPGVGTWEHNAPDSVIAFVHHEHSAGARLHRDRTGGAETGIASSPVGTTFHSGNSSQGAHKTASRAPGALAARTTATKFNTSSGHAEARTTRSRRCCGGQTAAILPVRPPTAVRRGRGVGWPSGTDPHSAHAMVALVSNVQSLTAARHGNGHRLVEERCVPVTIAVAVLSRPSELCAAPVSSTFQANELQPVVAAVSERKPQLLAWQQCNRRGKFQARCGAATGFIAGTRTTSKKRCFCRIHQRLSLCERRFADAFRVLHHAVNLVLGMNALPRRELYLHQVHVAPILCSISVGGQDGSPPT